MARSGNFNARLYKRLVEDAPDATVVVDPNGKIFLVNVQAEIMFGYDREELLGQPVEILVPERFRRRRGNRRARFFSSVGAGPNRVALERYGLRKDGSEF